MIVGESSSGGVTQVSPNPLPLLPLTVGQILGILVIVISLLVMIVVDAFYFPTLPVATSAAILSSEMEGWVAIAIGLEVWINFIEHRTQRPPVVVVSNPSGPTSWGSPDSPTTSGSELSPPAGALGVATKVDSQNDRQ